MKYKLILAPVTVYFETKERCSLQCPYMNTECNYFCDLFLEALKHQDGLGGDISLQVYRCEPCKRSKSAVSRANLAT